MAGVLALLKGRGFSRKAGALFRQARPRDVVSWRVNATVEKEEDAFPGYAKRAHNDLAEVQLETGLPGAILVLAFLVWFLRRSY
ncbi:MAG: hypothetical protein WBX25_15385 [Rhodomicrobium sp.]